MNNEVNEKILYKIKNKRSNSIIQKIIQEELNNSLFLGIENNNINIVKYSLTTKDYINKDGTYIQASFDSQFIKEKSLIPLYLSARKNRLEIFVYLLKFLSSSDKKLETSKKVYLYKAINHAIINKSTEIIKFVLDDNNLKRLSFPPLNLLGRNLYNHPSLMMEACHKGNLEIVDLFYSKIKDLLKTEDLLQTDYTGNSILTYCIYEKNFDVFRFLMKNHELNSFPEHFLNKALMYGDLNFIEYLLINKQIEKPLSIKNLPIEKIKELDELFNKRDLFNELNHKLNDKDFNIRKNKI